jgi:branched-chain amino acid transport system substrate-binding protein
MLTTIKGKNPDVVFHGGTETTGAPMLNQMREIGLRTQFMQGDFICSLPGLPVDAMPGAQRSDFKSRFEKKFGQIQLFAAYTYDAVMVMIAAMQKANSTDPAKYMPALANISHFGITGKIEFDKKGDSKNGFVTLYKAQCGKLEPLFVQKTTDLKQALESWKNDIPLLPPCGA